MVAELATTAAQSVASSMIGSATGAAAEKGAKHPAMEKQSTQVKVGIKASELLVSSIMTSLAVTMFNRVAKNYKGYSFILLAVALSSLSALGAAYVKIRL